MNKLVNGVVVAMTQAEEQAWLDSVSVVNPVPAQVSALQALLAIDAAGLSNAYNAWATSVDRTFAERAFIDKAVQWKRNDTVLISGATALGLTSEQVDQLFIAAASV